MFIQITVSVKRSLFLMCTIIGNEYVFFFFIQPRRYDPINRSQEPFVEWIFFTDNCFYAFQMIVY